MDVDRIDRETGMPPYRQCAAILRRRIHARIYTGKLPSETALAAEFGLAPNTVRKALAILRDEGYIETFQGWGSAVAAFEPDG